MVKLFTFIKLSLLTKLNSLFEYDKAIVLSYQDMQNGISGKLN